MRIVARQSALIAAPAGDVFDAATDIGAMSRTYRGYGPIPGVVSAQWTEGGGLAPGALRRATMTDRSVITERIVAVERPSLYRYEMAGGLAAPLSLVVRSGTSTFHFEEAGGATRVRWEYALELTSPVAWPLAFLVNHLFLVGWMGRSLRAVGELAATAPVRRGAAAPQPSSPPGP